MEAQHKPIYQDKIFLTGIVLTALSAIIFMLPLIDGINLKQDSLFGLFFFNYSITVTYLIILLINGFIKFRFAFFKNNIEYTLILLVLALISAFSLNREIAVFERSANWLCILLIAQCITMLLFTVRKHLPRLALHILYFCLGIVLIISIYFAVYLAPFYAIGLLGSIFFGMSLHVFVPLLFVVFSIVLIIRALRVNNHYGISVFTGALLPIVFAIVFILNWKELKETINHTINKGITDESIMPDWVNISQRIGKSVIAEKMIKAGLVYSTPNEGGFWSWRMPQRSFDEIKKHDPLVIIACLFFGNPELNENDRIKILESMYDSRHQAQERLWAGDLLETSNVISNIRIFPEYRMAYTEKILSVRNNGAKKWLEK